METQGFTPEENTQQVHVTPSEDTMESAAPGAIEVTEETGISVFESEVKKLPVVPKTLIIGGIEVNNDTLKETIEKDVLTMKIDGLGDKKGYDAAVVKLKELSKLRTGTKNFYAEVTKPVNVFRKNFKSQTDETQDLCTKGETYLEGIIEPIKNAVEIARQEAEKAKDELAVTRAEEMIALGGVYDGQGTYNFSYDGALFITSENLRELVDEAYLLKKDEIQTSFDLEQKRLQAIEDAKAQETTKLKSQVEDLNEERTEFRKEQLEMKKFKWDGVGFYVKGEEVISEDQILNLDKDQWKELFNPKPTVETHEQVGGEAGYVTVPRMTTGSVGGFTPESTSSHAEPTQAPPVTDSIVGDFAGFVPVEQEEVATEAMKEPVDITVLTRSLVFSQVKPFISFMVGSEYTMTIFPNEYADKIQISDELLMDGTVNEQLQFKLTQNAGA